MSVMTTIEVFGMTPEEYARVMDRLGVEQNPAPGIYLHVTARTEVGYRVVEIWDSEEGFNAFLAERLAPAAEAAGVTRDMQARIEPLHNLFGPRLAELPSLVPDLPGSPGRRGG